VYWGGPVEACAIRKLGALSYIISPPLIEDYSRDKLMILKVFPTILENHLNKRLN
jgi:hypothetical protein